MTRQGNYVPGPGRPTSYNDIVAAKLLNAFRAGASRRGAAGAGGISHTCLKGWINKGRAGVEPYATFYAKVQDVENDLIHRIEGVLASSALQDPKWALEWLKFRHKSLWMEAQRAATDKADKRTADAEDAELLKQVIAAYRQTGTGGK